MVPLQDSLARVIQLAKQLNESTDGLNVTIEAIEKSLADAGAGVTSWLDEYQIDEVATQVGVPPRPSIHEGWVIGYTKIGSDWKIAAKRIRRTHVYADGDPDCPWREIENLSEPSPLLKAPRQVRVEAARLLEPLLDTIASRMQGFIDSIEGARKVVASGGGGDGSIEAPPSKPRRLSGPLSAEDPAGTARKLLEHVTAIQYLGVTGTQGQISKLAHAAKEQAEAIAKALLDRSRILDPLSMEILLRQADAVRKVAEGGAWDGQAEKVQAFVEESKRILRIG
jgi:hypothetical protein